MKNVYTAKRNEDMIENLLTGNEIYFQLARFFIVLIVGLFLTKTVLVPIIGKLSSKKADEKATQSLENLSWIIGAFISFTVALQAAEFGNLVTVLGTLAAAVTVAVGFGMREQVSSLVAGVFIHTDNPFLKGDYIKVNDVEGVVGDIRMRTTILNGGENEKQVVPNHILTQNVVRNFTKGRKTKCKIQLTEKLGVIDQVKQAIDESVREIDGKLDKPEPKVIIDELEEDKAKIIVSFWIKSSDDVKMMRQKFLGIYSDKRKSIKPPEDEKDDEKKD